MKPFPNAQRITEFLRQLIGKAPTMKPAKAGVFPPNLPAFAGIYVEDGGTEPCATVVVDFNAAISLTGAFISTPPAVILESLKAKQCGEMVAPALYEILNVLGSLLNANGSVHVRLTEMIEFTGKPTGVPADLISRATQKMELETSIAPVPAGIVSLARI